VKEAAGVLTGDKKMKREGKALLVIALVVIVVRVIQGRRPLG
jgi:hypothetical protein